MLASKLKNSTFNAIAAFLKKYNKARLGFNLKKVCNKYAYF